MTKEELEILRILTKAGELIKGLPALYTDPNKVVQQDVQTHINALEHIVFAREGVRNYKKHCLDAILKTAVFGTGSTRIEKGNVRLRNIPAGKTLKNNIRKKAVKKSTVKNTVRKKK